MSAANSKVLVARNSDRSNTCYWRLSRPPDEKTPTSSSVVVVGHSVLTNSGDKQGEVGMAGNVACNRMPDSDDAR